MIAWVRVRDSKIVKARTSLMACENVITRVNVMFPSAIRYTNINVMTSVKLNARENRKIRANMIANVDGYG